MQTVHPLPVDPISFRSSLANLISPLKRIRPRVPFWQLASHRIPTLRLYRGLLRWCPDDSIRFRFRILWRQHKHSTSPTQTRTQLTSAYKLLDYFIKARDGDERSRLLLTRYGDMIVAKREKNLWEKAFREHLAWEEKLRNRPILTGTIVRPSLSNRAFPTMRPQPAHISMIIRKRRIARMRRIDKWKLLSEWRQDLQIEKDFENALAVNARKDGMQLERVFRDNSWDAHVKELQAGLQETFKRDTDRRTSPIPLELIAQVKEARREKFRNKAREAERERRGEVLNRTLRRRRKGPPAPVLALMTDKQKEMDKIARSVSEVGYVAMVKRKLGFKLRDPKRWMQELGSRQKWPSLRRLEREISVENSRRRRNANRVNP